MTPEEKRIREAIKCAIDDTVSDLCYYDRKEDEELTVAQFSEAISTKLITKDEIVYFFKEELFKQLNE